MPNVGGSSSGPELGHEMEQFQKKIVNSIWEKEANECRGRTDSWQIYDYWVWLLKELIVPNSCYMKTIFLETVRNEKKKKYIMEVMHWDDGTER